MDYDDNDAQGQNHHIVREGSDKVSPVLNSYTLPKYDFDDSLQGHLRFDSLVDNEVFLGITSQEDNHWIEEYSRENTDIQFSSSAVESTRKNVWSEATSSESVEMLLKSVGQEEKVLEETIIKDSDACDRPDSLINTMDPNLKQCNGNDPSANTHSDIVPDVSLDNFIESKVSSDWEQCQETQISGGELDLVVTSSKHNSSVGEAKADKLHNDVNLEAGKIANESFVNEVQEVPSDSNAECGYAGSSHNLVESVEEYQEKPQVPETGTENAGGQSKHVDTNEPDSAIKSRVNNMGDPTISGAVLETSTYSIDKISAVLHAGSTEKPLIEGSIHVDEAPTVPLPIESCDMEIDGGLSKELDGNTQEDPLTVSPSGVYVDMQATEDANPKSEIPDSPKSNVDCHVQSHSIEGTEIIVGADDQQVAFSTSMVEGSDNNTNTKSEIPDSLKSNAGSLVQSESVEGTENFVGDDGQQVTFGTSMVEERDKNANTKSEIPDSPNSNVVSHVQSHFVEGTENVVGDNGQQVTLGTSLVEGSDKNASTKSEIPDSPKSIVGSHVQSHSVDGTGNVVGDDGQQVAFGTYMVEGSDNNGNTKSEIPDSPKSNVGSLVQSHSLEGTEKVVGDDSQQVTFDTPMVEGNDSNNVGTTSIAASSAELSVDDISNNAYKVHTGDLNGADRISGIAQMGDETQSSEPDAITMDQDVTLNNGQDARLPSEFRDMDVAVAPDSQTNVEPSTCAEGCERVTAMAQGTEPNMAVITDAVIAVDSSLMSPPNTPDGAELASGTAATTDNVTEDQPRSPIFGVSLLHKDIEEKVKVGLSNENSSQKEVPEMDSTVDSVLDGPLPVFVKDTVSDGAENVLHGMVGPCDSSVGNINGSPSEQVADDNPGGLNCSKTMETISLSCDSSAEGGNKEEALQDHKESVSREDGVKPLANASSSEQVADDNPGGLRCTKTMETIPLPCDSSSEGGNKEEALLDTKGSMSSEDGVAANMSDEQQVSVDIAGPSARDANLVEQNEGDSSLIKPQTVDFSDTKSIELSQSAKDKPEVTTGSIHENSPVLTGSNDGKDLQSVSSTSAAKEEKNVTFEVNASTGPGETGIENLSFSKAPSAELPENSLVSPQTPSSAANEAGLKGISVPKPRKKSAGRETAKKDTHMKEKTPRRRSGPVEKLPVGHVTPISTSNPPDLNNLTTQFQQSFTDNQQVQLRAQILVYGSLISQVPPEEPHMNAAFGQSDGGRQAWEAAWHACIERVRGRKSQTPNLNTPTQSQSQSQSGKKDLDQGTKIGSAQSKVVSGISSSIVSPMISISSPLWNINTPGDYRQTSLHPYRTPPVQNFAGQNPAWLSQGLFPGQWVASSPVAPFNARLSALPITESVKLTTVKESGTSGTSVISVDPSAGPLVSANQPSSDSKSRKRKKVTANIPQVTPPPAPIAHLLQAPHTEDYNKSLFLAQNQTNPGTAPVISNHSTSAALSTPVSINLKSNQGPLVSINQPSSDSKSRKRKKVTVSQPQMILTSAPVAHLLQAPHTEDYNKSLFLAQNQTNPGTAPVISNHSPTSAALSTPVSINLKSNQGPLVSINQPSSDSKSRKRKKVTVSQPQMTLPSAPVAHLLQAPHTEDYNKIMFLAQNQTIPGTSPVVSNYFPTSAALLTHVSINSNSNLGHPSGIDQSVEKTVRREETGSKIEESKLRAADAAVHAADAVGHCQGVWNQLESQKNSGLVSDDEAKLACSAVSIAAAASIAKVAAAAARIASDVAEQARLMADEVFLSSRTESHGQSSMILPDKAMPTDHPTSIILAAREAARKRIEAASSASKHAENLDAILKAAELAAEAVSQAGKIVAMGKPLSLRALVEGGPEGYWKIPQSSNQQGSDKQNVRITFNDKEHQTLKHGSLLPDDSGDLTKNQINDGISGSVTSHGKDRSAARGPKGSDSSKTIGVIPEPEYGSVCISDADQNMPQSTSGTLKENVIREGCLVEVYKDKNKNSGAWFAANVMNLKDGKAFVCYTEIQSDDGSGQLKEWVPLEVEETEAPKIRIAHPMTTMLSEGTRKRGRTALTDTWFSGDRVDVWVQNCWCEAVVVETDKVDSTALTVQFPAHGETSVVRSWHVRPTLIYKDGKWIESSSLKGSRSSEGDAPLEKRQRFGSPIVEGKEKDTFSISVDLVGPRQRETNTLPFSAQGSSFAVGKSSGNENLGIRGTIKSGLKKERSRVVFGVPKPGKKQKFMDVRTQYVADGSNKNNDSVNLAGNLMAQAPAARTSRNNSKNDAKEKQVVEVKPKAPKSRKPPVPSVRSLAQKDRPKSSKSTSRDAFRADENSSSHQNHMDFGSSNTEDAKETSTSKAISQRLNKGKIAGGDRKATKVEVREQSTSEVEIRRSNRRIQPTSRLLEGLQSSLTVSKLPSASHASQRSHKVTSKAGGPNSS